MTKLVRKPLYVVEVTWGPVTYEYFADFKPETAEDVLGIVRTAITIPSVAEKDVEVMMQLTTESVEEGRWTIRDYADDCLVTREEVMSL